MYRAEEDYLKVIYELQVELNKPLIKTSELKDSLKFSDQTINDMIKRLEEKQLIKFIPYKGVSLTKKGIKIAVKFVRAHRVWEVFLSENLNYPWHLVHEEAERLEHASSLKMVEALYKHLGEPKYCSHGNPIPKDDNDITIINDISLSSLNINEKIIIKRVLDDKELLKTLTSLKLGLNSKVKLINKDLSNHFISIELDNTNLILPLSIGDKIFGNKIN